MIVNYMKTIWSRAKSWNLPVICCMALTLLNSFAYAGSYIAETVGTGSGAINTYDYGININCATGSTQGCFGQFNDGMTVLVYATPSSKSVFAGWGGKCFGSVGNPCSLFVQPSMIEQYITATFNLKPMFKNGTSYFYTMQDVLNNATDGSTILGLYDTFAEDIIFSSPINVTVDGGKGDDFNSTVGCTEIKGSLTITNGSLIVSYLSIS